MIPLISFRIHLNKHNPREYNLREMSLDCVLFFIRLFMCYAEDLPNNRRNYLCVKGQEWAIVQFKEKMLLEHLSSATNAHNKPSRTMVGRLCF